MWNFRSDYCDIITRYTDDLIFQEGYLFEKHSVTTEDGYINTMYRIPYGKGQATEKNPKPRPPVILFHGLACSCAVFLNQSCLAYYLADEGFDVWLPNNRGTTYSRKHKKLDPSKDEQEYWSFSWHEIAVFDNTAFVDYVLKKTGKEQLSCIGHSQGATTAAVFLSEKPEYNEKINMCCLLGPSIIFKQNLTYPLKFYVEALLPIFETIHEFFKLPLYQLPLTGVTRTFLSLVPSNAVKDKITCFFLYLLAGHANYLQTQINFNKLGQTTPNTACILQVYHYMQIMRSGKFARYDYGKEKNFKVYGYEDPPLYDLSKITSPTGIFYSKNDMFNQEEDIKTLIKLLPNVVHEQVVACELFNHVDFLTAKDSIPLCYSHVSKLLKKYT